MKVWIAVVIVAGVAAATVCADVYMHCFVRIVGVSRDMRRGQTAKH
jgi:hypothetical protein